MDLTLLAAELGIGCWAVLAGSWHGVEQTSHKHRAALNKPEDSVYWNPEGRRPEAQNWNLNECNNVGTTVGDSGD